MKLFINARFLTQPISGVQRYAIECSRQIKKIHPESVFLSPQNILHKDIAEELGVITIGRNTGHKWEQLDLPFYLFRKGGKPLLNLANTAPWIYANNFVVIHDLAFFHHPEWNSKQFATWYNILIPRIARGSRHIFTVSQTIKNELIKYYKEPAAKISVTYNGLGEHLLAGQTEFPATKDKMILSVGTFNTRKNQQNIAKAFLKSDIYKNYLLVFVGDKNKVFSESGLSDADVKQERIKVYDSLNNEELKALYQKAEIVVSLSDYEGFGIPILEGLFFGCKILCSDIPVYRELFDGYVTYCNQHDIEGVAAVLDTIAGNPRKFERESVNLLLEKYSYKKAAQAIIEKIGVSYKSGIK